MAREAVWESERVVGIHDHNGEKGWTSTTKFICGRLRLVSGLFSASSTVFDGDL
ncbi:hypothetical protein K466DRAFT_303802 [Polyporus arcularius HHB13444]|uniref:Uncharacterized protein n=1 Tax=Polyporus arcularius HHB13444 TaxID=1314778 RepID=A0A5C3P197_9APHY|nr:hypothetical protein K466DRAFT_156387 [Polyporus arcularius HHB13444]TFK82378.1 hypothetical protein K466DRAFT_303802 [Polyporus arcularius HHB13444]